jgi:hypothetical protein
LRPSTHIRAALPASGPRWAAAAILLCAAARNTEDAPKVTVQALPRFEELRCLDSSGQLEVRGRLLDDVGMPLADVPIELARGSGASVQATPCGAARGRSHPLRTDATGEICVALPKAHASGSLTLRFAGDSLHLPAEGELALEPHAKTLRLAFDSPSLELDLDQPEQRLTLQLSSDGTAADGALPTVAVQLEEAGRLRPVPTRDWSRAGNSLSFSVDSSDLGAPGPARLLAQVEGAAQAEAVALRSTSVRLERASVTVGADSETVELQIAAQSRAGAPTSGWVEVSLDEQVLASSPLVNGVASLQAPLAAAASTPWLARYHSDDPWWQPGAPLPIDVTSPTEREPARWPWLVLLAPVGYVCVRALQRPGFRKPPRIPRRSPTASPATTLASADVAAPSGWSGTVRDAHDGRPISGARVTAALPSLLAEAGGASTVSDAYGHYVLPPLREPIPEGAQLLVASRLHSDFQRPLPPQGRVDVTLTSRRRALLGRLVRWARSAGPPWHRATEPTPGEIANVAVRRGDLDTARWAESVQAAAFDHSEVDDEREAAVQAVEPPWQSGQPEGRPAPRSS